MTARLMTLGRKAAGGGPEVEDTFDRADSGTLGTTDTGQAWTTHAGTFEIVSDRAYSISSNGVFVSTVDAGFSDIDMSVVSDRLNVSTSDPGVVFRFVDINNYWSLTLSTQTYLHKRVAGTYTAVRTLGGYGTGTHTVRITAVGSAIECFVGGSSIMTATDSDHSTATKHGIDASLGGQNTSGCYWNDLTVEEL